MKKNFIFLGIICLSLIFILGCIDGEQTRVIPGINEPARTIEEYTRISFEKDNVYNQKVEVIFQREMLMESFSRNYKYGDIIKQSGILEEGLPMAVFYKGNFGVMCIESELMQVFCFKFVENASDGIIRGVGFDIKLVDVAEIEYVGAEKHDSVITDCFKVIPPIEYLDDYFREIGYVYGPVKYGEYKLCYGRDDGFVRRLEGDSILEGRLHREDTQLRFVSDINYVRGSTIRDVEPPVNFAIGDVDCLGEATIDLEFISLREGGVSIEIDSYLIGNQTLDVEGHFKINRKTHAVSSIESFDYVYFNERPFGIVCDKEDEAKDNCVVLYCD